MEINPTAGSATQPAPAAPSPSAVAPSPGTPDAGLSLEQRIAAAVEARITTALTEHNKRQGEWVAKVNRELRDGRLAGRELPAPDGAPTPTSGQPGAPASPASFEANVMAAVELMQLKARFTPEERTAFDESSRGVSLEAQLRLAGLLAARSGSGSPVGAPAPVVAGRGAGPALSQAVTYPRTQSEYAVLTREQRNMLGRDPGFDPCALPHA